MNNKPDYHLQDIARKLVALKSIDRLNKGDREIIDEIINTDIPIIQDLLRRKGESKA